MRAVHGRSHHGQEEVWLYIPEKTNDKSKAKRRGWWLHPDTDEDGLYYIGSLADIQKNKTKGQLADVATFPDFPFTRTCLLHANTKQVIRGSLRCVTARRLTSEELARARRGLNEDSGSSGEDSSASPSSSDEQSSGSDFLESAVRVPAVEQTSRRSRRVASQTAPPQPKKTSPHKGAKKIRKKASAKQAGDSSAQEPSPNQREKKKMRSYTSPAKQSSAGQKPSRQQPAPRRSARRRLNS